MNLLRTRFMNLSKSSLRLRHTKEHKERIMYTCLRRNIFLWCCCIVHYTTTASSFVPHNSIRRTTMTMSMGQLYAEEKKDDGILYWEPSFNGFQQLPSFKKQPKMIVFDKDGTLGADAASLKRWVDHMTHRLTSSLREEQQTLQLVSQDDVIEEKVNTFYQVIGWDASVGRVIPSAPLAAGTWEEQVETCSTLFQTFGLPFHVAQEWHKEVSNLHSTDLPLIDDLRGLLQKCHDFGMRVAICTSDDRGPTNAALRNWDITDLVHFSICGDEVMESKPSAMPLQILCQQASLQPEDCIVVGDTSSDTGMARNAGAGLCIGVLTGSGTADQLMDTGANVILPHVGDIPTLLESMGMTPPLAALVETELLMARVGVSQY